MWRKAAVVLGWCILAGCPGTDPQPPDGGAEEACPAPAATPRQHAGAITADETWTAAESPHLVTSTVRVRGGATLTIEPCAEVRFAPGASLIAGVTGSTPEAGRLVADGSEARTIRFVRDGAQAWGGVNILYPGSASLRHVTLEGGGDNSSYHNATLVVRGEGGAGLQQNTLVDHVTVRGSKGAGVSLGSSGSFVTGSGELTVEGSGAGDAMNPDPLRVGPLSLGTIPPGRYTGNARDLIHVESGEILLNTTMRNVGVPYRLIAIPGSRLVVRATDSAGMVTLTIEPGVELQFDPETYLRVGVGSASRIDYPGALVAVGTAASPIVFTSSKENPAAGDWSGVVFNGSNSTNRLEHLRIEYAGGECSCSLAACFPTNAAHEYAISLEDVSDGSFPDFIDNVTIAHSAMHGIVCSFDSAVQCPDFLAGNTFEQVAGCKQILNRDESGSCTARTSCP